MHLLRRTTANAVAGRRLPSRPARLVCRKVAAVQEQPTASSPSPSGDDNTSSSSSAPAAALESSAADYRLQQLDAAQEELLKWMLFVDEEEQERDLGEMVDYAEFSALAGAEADDDLQESVEKMMEQSAVDLRMGDRVMGTVYEVDEDGAYVEVGAKTAGFVPLSECSLARLKSPLEALRPGVRREFVVVEEEDEFGEVILSLAALEAQTFWQRTRQLMEEDMPVTVTVTGSTRGGLLVRYEHVDGFVPLSAIHPSLFGGAPASAPGGGGAMDPAVGESLIGAVLPVKFMEVDEERERVVFSHRRATADGDLAPALSIGDVVLGVVQAVKPYGAFVDIGGVQGLLHISQITADRVLSVESVLAVGDKLKVMVLSQDRERGRVTLSTKKLEPSPGDMLHDPQLVFEKAEEMAALFRARLDAADAAYLDQLDGYNNNNGGQAAAGGQQQAAAGGEAASA